MVDDLELGKNVSSEKIPKGAIVRVVDEFSDFEEMIAAALRGAIPIIVPRPEKILFHNPHTTVHWVDGTKTCVTATEGDEFHPMTGFCAAFAKKSYGSRTAYKRMVYAISSYIPKKELDEARKLRSKGKKKSFLARVISAFELLRG